MRLSMSIERALILLKAKFIDDLEDDLFDQSRVELLSRATANPWTDLKVIRLLYQQRMGYSSTEGDEFLIDDLIEVMNS